MKTIKNNKKSLYASNFQLLSKHQLGLLVGGDGKDKTNTDPGGAEGTIVANPIVIIKK